VERERYGRAATARAVAASESLIDDLATARAALAADATAAERARAIFTPHSLLDGMRGLLGGRPAAGA